MKPFAWLILSALLIATPSAAQQPSDPAAAFAGQVIERFEVTGNTSVARDTIRVYLGVNPGEAFDPAALRRNFLNLWQTGLFDDVRIETEKGATGVVVRAVVKERPRIGAVEYRGNKNLNLTKINEALDAEKIDLHIGNTMEQTTIRRAVEAIKSAYAEGGFEGVTVEAVTEQMIDPGEMRIVFNITEGIKAKVAGIDFTGNNRFSDRRLRSVMKEVKSHNLVTWVRKKNVYIPSKLEEDLEKVKNLYQDYGFKDVEIGDPQVKTIGKRVQITIPVREGDVHTFGKVSVSGNTVFTEENIIGRWPLKSGEVLSRKPIQARLDLFDELYRRRGYIYAYINPQYVERDNNVVDVEIEVYEGEQFRLGRLEFEGNTVTKDKVLRREIFLDEGQIMDMETFKASMYKLGQLGYFKITENPDFKVNPETKTVDITVKGVEEGKNDIQFGGGYSEAYGVFGQFQFATRNFLGEGESFGISYQSGRRQDFFSLSYSDPWFLDRPHSLGVSIYNRQTIYPDSVGFESNGKGGSIAYGFRIDRFESVSVMYGLERREEHTEFVLPPDSNGNIPLPAINDEEFTTSGIVPSYRYDSRDNPYDTFQGTRALLSIAYSGGPFGGTINTLKPVLNFTRYHRLSRQSSVGINVEVGQIFPLAEDDCANYFSELKQFENELCVPRTERFYLGGEYSLRGFRSYSISPVEVVNGRDIRVGGHKFNVVNFEYLYKINDPLRFVLWADAGNTYAYKENWDVTDFRYSLGAELRIFLPVFQFPLRFIYALNPDEKEDDDFQSFQFSIGNTF
ncbi:MAG: outer membrane protein assembly factor BamA [Thermoanaerobaculia bacterium]